MKNSTLHIIFFLIIFLSPRVSILASDYPDVEFQIEDNIFSNYFKTYSSNNGDTGLGNDSVVISSSYSAFNSSSVNGITNYYLQFGTTASSGNSSYASIESNKKINKVEFLVSSSTTDGKILSPVVAGWDSLFNQLHADVGFYTDTITVGRGLSAAKWISYDFSKYNVSKVRFYRSIKNFAIYAPDSVEASSSTLGTTTTTWLFGIRVFLRKAEKPKLKSIALKGISIESIADTMSLSTYGKYSSGAAINISSDIAYTVDSSDCSISFYKGSSSNVATSFVVGDTIVMKITKNEMTSTYLIITSAIAPVPTISLNSNSGSSYQRVVQKAEIEPIVFDISNAVSVSCENLPDGVTFNSSTYTISGAPVSIPSTYEYKVIVKGLTDASPNTVYFTGTIKVLDVDTKKILYLTSSDATSDLFYNNLLDNYVVTLRAPADVAKTESDYSNYDLLIIQESVAGTNAEALGMKSIDKPILNMKAFLYGTQSSSTVRWGWGNPDNGSGSKVMYFNYVNHPVFDDFDTSGGYIQIINDSFTTTSNKTIQLITNSTISGYPVSVCNGDIAIQEVLPSVRVSATSTSKYLLVPIYSEVMDDLSDEGIALLNNAVNYLLGSTQFDYTTEKPIYSLGVKLASGSNANVFSDGNKVIIKGAKNYGVVIYDVLGNLVLSKKILSDYESFTISNPGIYVVKINTTSVKIIIN